MLLAPFSSKFCPVGIQRNFAVAFWLVLLTCGALCRWQLLYEIPVVLFAIFFVAYSLLNVLYALNAWKRRDPSRTQYLSLLNLSENSYTPGSGEKGFIRA